MTTELTTEWLEQAIAAMESDRDDMPFGLSDWQNNTLAALKLALQCMTATPAAWLVTGGRLYKDRSYDSLREAEIAAANRKDGSVVVPLSRHDDK